MEIWDYWLCGNKNILRSPHLAVASPVFWTSWYLTAIVKCLGVVAISAGAQAGVSKKFFVNIVNEKILLILLRALDHRAYHPVVSYNACISLYNIFHDSEQARATAKAIIESSSTVLESFSSHQHDFQLTSLLSVVGNYLK